MRRRDFIALLSGAPATWPLAAHAQQPAGRIYRVGYLSVASRERSLRSAEAFEDGLRRLGYRVGENVTIEYRFANGEMERLPALAVELVRFRVDIIIAASNPSTVATMTATTTIPIVMVAIVDPVGTRLVTSLARPGGNVTGLAVDAAARFWGKRFELLKETLPNLSRLGIMWNPDVEVNRSRQAAMTETARSLGLTTIPVEVRGVDTLEQAFATMTKERVHAFVLQGDSVLHEHRGQIAEMAIRNRLPSAAVARQLAEAGFLLSYGADLLDLYRRAAGFVDKIFKGAKPADLPAQQPTKFELVINLKTAKALGLATDTACPRRRSDRIDVASCRPLALFGRAEPA